MKQTRTPLIYIIMCMLLCCTYTKAQVAGDVISVKESETGKYFYSKEIPDDVFRRMQGKSFPKGCTVKRSDLRYLRVLHRNLDGQTQVGEMVCNKAISSDLIDIFRSLYDARYPIERMVLIDDYGADDGRSMAANNTSCFNFRFITGSQTKVSKHGMGMAVDLNPLYNPYVKGNKVEPAEGRPYAFSRNPPAGEKWASLIINRSSLPCRLFVKHGFRWGGAWKSLKDYQHFEK